VTQVVIHAITEADTDPTAAAAELKAYLQDTEGVGSVAVRVEHPRAGLAEVMAIIQLASAAIDLTSKLIDFIKSRQAKGDKSKVKDIEIEIDGERVSIGSLTPDQRTRLTAALAQGT
jgi:hypothetical protein